ncbi:MAG: restriction endonuclease PLD domain-containing protein [Pseudohongiellaceae bacterium]
MTRDCKLTIVSPYISAFGRWKSIIEFSRFFMARHARPYTLITRPPGPAGLTLDQAIKLCNMGIDLRIRTRPPLHSKIYLFKYDDGDYTAFIGSANLTLGGFKRNDETVARFRFVSRKSEILTEVQRLSELGATPFENWKMKNRFDIKNQ